MVKLHELNLCENEFGVDAEIVVFSDKKFRIEIKSNIPKEVNCGIERCDFAKAIAEKSLKFADELEKNYL